MKYTDIMLDFETLADTPNAAILSMAAVPFNLETGEMGSEFYEHIDLQSCLDAGMEVTGNTFYWWLTKSEAARIEITRNEKRRHINYIPSVFRAWVCGVRHNLGEAEIRIWGNGAKFDLGIIDNIFRKNRCINPFNFRNERCVRTYASLRPDIMASFEFQGTKHHPVDDCRNQIRYVCQIHSDINKVK
jgi:exodeoxyribonuclease VIII